MKRTSHLANVFFEEDLNDCPLNLSAAIQKHPNYYQLQFLPLLYAKKDEPIIVSHQPGEIFPFEFVTYDDILKQNSTSIDFWGYSNQIDKLHRELNFSMITNQLDVVRMISSKSFTFPYSSRFIFSLLIQDIDTLNKHIQSLPYPVVLKASQGFAGRGHLFVNSPSDFTEDLFSLISCALTKNQVFILEPWLKRVHDFSSQWFLTDQIECLGSTLLINDSKGRYKGNIVFANDPHLLHSFPKIKEHYEKVKPLLNDVHALGYRGNLGIDAFTYEENNELKMHPIVEINPRKTMGYVALKAAENVRIQSPIFIRLQNSNACSFPLLPKKLKVEGKTITFKKNLEVVTDLGVIKNASDENSRWKAIKWNH